MKNLVTFNRSDLQALGERLQPPTDKDILSHEGAAAVRYALAQRGFSVTVKLGANCQVCIVRQNGAMVAHEGTDERHTTLRAAIEAMKVGWLELGA